MDINMNYGYCSCGKMLDSANLHFRRCDGCGVEWDENLNITKAANQVESKVTNHNSSEPMIKPYCEQCRSKEAEIDNKCRSCYWVMKNYGM